VAGESLTAHPTLCAVILERIQVLEAGVDGLALRNHREVQIFIRLTDPNKISGYCGTYFPYSFESADCQRSKYCLEVGNNVTILGQEAPTVKVLLNSAPLEVFLEGLPSHCCLFRGALKPPLFCFFSALCGSRKFDTFSRLLASLV